MPAKLRPLSEQTVVITGATSGHGLSTARRFARNGAQVILVSRSEDDLIKARDQIVAAGGRADFVATDMGDEAAVERLAETVITRYGGFDTWINNAGVGIYAELVDTPTEDHRRLFETNYWGYVYGSLAAVRHLKTRPGGGALINVGSINGDLASPLLGAYNASKHAVKGFTNSLRIEMLREGAPVSVTLIKPGAIGTPFPQHGRNLTGAKARLPRPMYSPEVTADAIVFAATHPRRAITVGGVGRAQVAAFTLAPVVFDHLASLMGPMLIDKSSPVGFEDGNLEHSSSDGPRTEGEQKGRRFSLYTTMKTNPGLAPVMALAGGAALATWAVRRSGRIVAAGGLAAAALTSTAARGGARHLTRGRRAG